MVIEIERTRSLDVTFPPEQLYGAIYGGERNAHKFIITSTRNDAEITLSGTVTARFLRADNVDVALEGTIEGGKACVTLGDECYAVPGRYKLAIFVTSGTETLCVYAAIGNSDRTAGSSTVDGGEIIESVADLIADIEAARATIPATYTNLMAGVAGTYDATKTYAVGDYVWYDGQLKRCIVPITTAESWTAAHWANAVIGDDLNVLKSAFDNIFREYNICFDILNRQTGVNWAGGTGLSTTTGSQDIIKCPITGGGKYWFANPGGVYSNAVRFADATDAYLSNISSFATIITVPTTAAYVYIKCPIGSQPFAVTEADYNNYVLGYKRNLKETYVEDAVNALGIANSVKQITDDIVVPSLNLANRSEFTENKYMAADGRVVSNSTYYYSNKMPVSEGDVIYCSPAVRYVTAFNGNNVVSATVRFPFTVPSGITHLVVSGWMVEIDMLMVSKNYELPYVKYGEHIKNEYIIGNRNSLNGNNGISKEEATLAANTTLEISDYPKALAKNDRITGYCEFSTFGETYFGYGYGAQEYISVDETNIKLYSNGVLTDTIAHEINISDYLALSIIMDNDRDGQITINSTGGNATAEITLGYAKNGLPFLRSTVALSNVKISAICSDIRKPIWWFGDSYSSFANERVIGQLNNYGVIDNMLIDAVPGMRSYYDANTGGYIDFKKLIQLATPKYIIWSLGMNDTLDNYKNYLKIVQNYCDKYGVELYAVKIPSVPNIDNSGKNAYIDTLGIKSIDWAKAVNATSAGVWYTGYLSSDNVHPTVLGAKAMATRTLVDCPAIMQY